MKESVHTFGENGSLLGILTEPDSWVLTTGTLGILFLNAGLLHHVGPNRMWVDMARRFSNTKGVVSFRFDLTGFGDSQDRRTEQSYQQRSMADIGEAMDFVYKRKGVAKFILIGFCSGAENAHYAALTDPRIAGVVFMDGFAYRSYKFYIKRYGLILLNPIKMIRFLFGFMISLPNRFSKKKAKESDEKKQIFASELPPKDEYVRDLRALIDKRVTLLFIFSKGMYQYYNYKKQFYDVFGTIDFKGYLTCRFFHHADHMYTMTESRQVMFEEIEQWIDVVKGE